MSETVTAVQARLPDRLLHEANALVKEGWFESLDSVLQEALRRYLDAHRSDLLDRFVREDEGALQISRARSGRDRGPAGRP